MRPSHFVAMLGLLASMHVGPAAAQPVGPPNEIWCNRTGIVASGPATVSVVAGVAGRTTSICGWIASATAAATMTIITGTGATCGTGTASITAVHAIPAGGAQSIQAGSAFYSVPMGNNVCATIGGTGPVQLTLMYSQF